AFQEAPVSALMGSVAKHIFLVTDPLKLEATVRTAFEIARTGRPGPVVVDIPKDVQNWEGVFHGEGLLPIPGYRRRMHELSQAVLDTPSAERFFAMLGESRRPLIYAGGGVINANSAGDDCDFLIAVGARFDDRVAGVPAKFARNARHIAHLDVDRAEVNKVKRVHWSYVGLVAGALRALTAHGRQRQFQADFSPWRA